MNRQSARRREGYLFVSQPSKGKLGKGWKKKFVIVRQNKSSSGKSVLLELYVERDAHNKPVISKLLEGVDSITRIPSKIREHAFEIKSGEKTLLGVASDSESETFDWMDAFEQQLLEPKKELEDLPDIGNDFCKVSVIPNKDSQRLELMGDYYVVVKEMKVFLHDPYTGEMKRQWDMHHLKKVLVTSKCNFRDKEKIMHFHVSSRSEHGKAQILFFSFQARRLADTIFQTLSGAISVTSRQTRSASMVFEITAKDLKRMMMNRDPDTESVASMAFESTKEEERSVQTIPEEMGQDKAKESSKENEAVEKNGETKKKETEKDQSVEEKDTAVGSEEKVDREKDDMSEQSNGHVRENNEDGAEADDANVEEDEVGSSTGTKENGVEISMKDDSEEVSDSNDKSSSGIETGRVNEEKEVPESEVQNNQSANIDESTTSTEEVTHAIGKENGSDDEKQMQEARKETDEPEQHDVAIGEESSSLQETTDRVSSPEQITLTFDQPAESQPDQSSDLTPLTGSPAATEEENNIEMPDENKEELVDVTAGGEVSVKLENSEQNSGNVEEESAELTRDSLSAETDTKVNGSPVNDGQTLAHDTSTDSGFINDAGDCGSNVVSTNTNNNNSRESLNCTIEDNGNGHKQTVETSDISNQDDQESKRDKAEVLPEFGLPVDVADLEEISVIVYSEDSPEVLV